MRSVLHVVRYILTNNSFITVPYFLMRGIAFQIYKRLTGRAILKRLFNGKQIYLTPHCAVSSFLAYTPIPDRKEIMLLRRLAQKDSIFLDIGAHIGVYSVMLMDVVQEIHAFEPHPATNARCRNNFSLNGVDPQRVHELALSDVAGEVFFSNTVLSDATNRITTDSSNSLRVRAETLDQFAQKYLPVGRPYLVKIDVEGFEAQVFKGGATFFKDWNVNGIIFECFAEARKTAFNILTDFGYHIEPIEQDNFYAAKS